MEFLERQFKMGFTPQPDSSTLSAQMKMRLCALRFFVASAVAIGLSSSLSAQLTISYLNGTNGAHDGTGQSYIPGDAGSFPTSTAYLSQMTFITSPDGDWTPASDTTPTYLNIFSDAGLSTLVGASTNTQLWDVGNVITLTWSFDDLALDTSTTYYAAFSTAPTAGFVINQPIECDNSSPYPDGYLIYNGSNLGFSDANFTATFQTVPEPSTYGALAGLTALGLALVRRRR
jgi:hypothetical protein